MEIITGQLPDVLRTFKVFVDFDGTISKKDIGEAFLNAFGDPVKIKDIIDLWIEGKITSPESWIMMLDTIDNFNYHDLDLFLDKMEIDPAFPGFVEYCNSSSMELRVLSDGLDLYIDKIMKRENLTGLEIYSNKALVVNNKITPVFPYGDEECKLCGNCKRNHVLTNSADDDFIVYVGDGYSDKCPIQFCDFIFAKDSLLKYCEVNRITYFPFNDFNDVQKKLDELRSKKRLKKRHQAELKRNEVFRQG